MDGARLSGLLNKKFHCSGDQLFAITQEFDVTKTEYNYLENLYAYNISQNKSRKPYLKERLDEAKKELLKTEHFIKAEKITTSNFATTFFMDPWNVIVHQFLCLEHYKTHYQEIPKLLGISSEKFKNILTILEQLETIKFEEARVHILKDLYHLAEDASILEHYTKNLRQLMSARATIKPHQVYKNFSVVFCGNKHIKDDLLYEINQLIQKAEVKVRNAPKILDEVIYLAIDLQKI
jgi:hypothetical protein